MDAPHPTRPAVVGMSSSQFENAWGKGGCVLSISPRALVTHLRRPSPALHAPPANVLPGVSEIEAKKLLGSYSGIVITDGYCGYSSLKKQGTRFRLAL